MRAMSGFHVARAGARSTRTHFISHQEAGSQARRGPDLRG